MNCPERSQAWSISRCARSEAVGKKSMRDLIFWESVWNMYWCQFKLYVKIYRSGSSSRI